MIYIISGNKNIGKTSRLINHINMSIDGVGVLTINYQKVSTVILLVNEDNKFQTFAI